MKAHEDKVRQNEVQQFAVDVSDQAQLVASNLPFADNRPEVITQRKLLQMAGQHTAGRPENPPQVQAPPALPQLPPKKIAERFEPIQRKENNTGLPDQLKSGIENLSHLSMDDVKVHYHSGQPAQLQAYAFTQGNNIHLAPGQEKHLPHEAWHVVQQKQGRVKATTQYKGKIHINDDAGLEKEADVMGRKAFQYRAVSPPILKPVTPFSVPDTTPIQRVKLPGSDKDIEEMEDEEFVTAIKSAFKRTTLNNTLKKDNNKTEFLLALLARLDKLAESYQKDDTIAKLIGSIPGLAERYGIALPKKEAANATGVEPGTTPTPVPLDTFTPERRGLSDIGKARKSIDAVAGKTSNRDWAFQVEPEHALGDLYHFAFAAMGQKEFPLTIHPNRQDGPQVQHFFRPILGNPSGDAAESANEPMSVIPMGSDGGDLGMVAGRATQMVTELFQKTSDPKGLTQAFRTLMLSGVAPEDTQRTVSVLFDKFPQLFEHGDADREDKATASSPGKSRKQGSTKQKVLIWIRIKFDGTEDRNTDDTILRDMVEAVKAAGMVPILLGDDPLKVIAAKIKKLQQEVRGVGSKPSEAITKLEADAQILEGLMGKLLRDSNTINMLEFWNWDLKGEKFLRGDNQILRQLNFIDILRQLGVVAQIGVKSGAMDGPAFMGLPTLVLDKTPPVKSKDKDLRLRMARFSKAVEHYEIVFPDLQEQAKNIDSKKASRVAKGSKDKGKAPYGGAEYQEVQLNSYVTYISNWLSKAEGISHLDLGSTDNASEPGSSNSRPDSTAAARPALSARGKRRAGKRDETSLATGGKVQETEVGRCELNDSHNPIQVIYKDRTLQVIQVPDDGNCFFHCCEQFPIFKGQGQANLRAELSNSKYIAEARKATLANNKEYATEEDILAMAQLYDIVIELHYTAYGYEHKEVVPRLINEAGSKGTMRLLYQDHEGQGHISLLQ